jgi:hypothetical protein
MGVCVYVCVRVYIYMRVCVLLNWRSHAWIFIHLVCRCPSLSLRFSPRTKATPLTRAKSQKRKPEPAESAKRLQCRSARQRVSSVV